jgi:hypothetical protein
VRQFIAISIGLFCAIGGNGQTNTAAPPQLVQATLTRLGGTPFYLQATISELSDPNDRIEVEMSWVAPDKWKRKIQSQEFSQTLIVDGDRMFEQDSSDYLPLAIEVLTSAMVSPQTVLDSYRPGDFARTKANGLTDESGKVCFSANSRMCGMSRNGLAEFVGAAGRSLEFTDYRKFKGERVARLLIYRIDHGDSWQARINTLGELQKHDEATFQIDNPTEKPNQIRAVVVQEAELRGLAQQPLEIIWPQVLEDNNTIGQTSYYVSLDRSGQAREVLPLSVAIERADDSARRQILGWKFKPVLRNGVPVQAESILNFSFNTRAYGPPSPLTDEEVRKLATNLIDPIFPEGTAPPGSTFEILISVDQEGNIIESMAGDGPHAMYQPCSKAVGKWHFSPIIEDGKPRPYRAKVICRVP